MKDLTNKKAKAFWKKAKAYFKKHPDEIKMRRTDPKNNISYSVIRVNGKLYAIDKHVYLGYGTYSKVKIALSETGEKFAVKIKGKEDKENDHEYEVLDALKLTQGKVTRKLKEIKKLIKNPNKRNHFNRVESDERTYILMPLYEGETLLSLLNKDLRKPFLSEKQKILIALKICEVVHALHLQNVLHCDLKLDNFIVKSSGDDISITIIDYGFGEILPKDRDSKKLKFAKGAREHCAPEIIRGFTYSRASDVYSLARTLDLINHDLFLDLYPDMALHDSDKRITLPTAIDKLNAKLLTLSKPPTYTPLNMHIKNKEKSNLSKEKKGCPWPFNLLKFC